MSGRSNEMFSDFDERVVGIPQLVPSSTNVAFDGPGGNEDFGRDAAIRYHLDAVRGVALYDLSRNGVDADLAGPIAPMAPILARLDPLVGTPEHLSGSQIESIVAFVGDGLLDPGARPERLRRLIPRELPSGREPLRFER